MTTQSTLRKMVVMIALATSAAVIAAAPASAHGHGGGGGHFGGYSSGFVNTIHPIVRSPIVNTIHPIVRGPIVNTIHPIIATPPIVRDHRTGVYVYWGACRRNPLSCAPGGVIVSSGGGRGGGVGAVGGPANPPYGGLPQGGTVRDHRH